PHAFASDREPRRRADEGDLPDATTGRVYPAERAVRPVGDPDGVEAIGDRVGAVSDRDRRHLPARSSVYLRDGAIELVDDPHLAVSHGNAGGPLADPDAVLDPPGRGVDTTKETIGRVGHPHRTGA